MGLVNALARSIHFSTSVLESVWRLCSQTPEKVTFLLKIKSDSSCFSGKPITLHFMDVFLAKSGTGYCAKQFVIVQATLSLVPLRRIRAVQFYLCFHLTQDHAFTVFKYAFQCFLSFFPELLSCQWLNLFSSANCWLKCRPIFKCWGYCICFDQHQISAMIITDVFLCNIGNMINIWTWNI